ncbi:trigger factor [Reichenbachiella versicolor]|uniref:trigger factor n=1 Tax=Reichenbachiella versicolor TaxID=1821036 RepID=UPI000D6E3A5E|nr:trigger factor [Reichenbachiella versicolor]
MNIQLDQISDVEALIKINLEEADYQPKVEAKLKEYSKKAQIKGFRPGKVPKTLIQKMYGESILVDEVNQMVSHQVMDYIKEKEIQILGEPLPNVEKVKDLDWKNTKEFEFEYNIGIAQDFDLKVDKKVKVDTFTIKVDQELIDDTVSNIKKQFGESTNPEESEEGDSLYGTVLSKEEGEEGYGGEIDIADVATRSRKKFIGVKSGDVLEFDPTTAIKDIEKRAQLVGEDNKETKGKIKYEVKNINRVAPAELNQDLFDKTFGKDLVKSEEEFLEKIKSTLAENYEKETDGYTDLKIKDKFVETVKIDLPDDFLKRWLEKSNDKLTNEEIEKDYPLYTNDLKWSMIKNKIAKDNEIKAEHEEVTEEAKNMIRAQFGSMGMSEQMEGQIDQFAQNYLQGEEGQNYMKLHEKVFNDKVTAFIKENITIKSKEVTLEEYKKKA